MATYKMVLGFFGIFWGLAAAAPYASAQEPLSSRDLGIDLDYYFPAENLSQIKELSDVTGFSALSEIVRIGGRAVQWADLVQRDTPVAEREQVWRRIDRIGHEATPEAPMNYNPTMIQQMFDDAIALTPVSMRSILAGSDALPAQLPTDTDIHQAIVPIRKIQLAYSRASRWLGLYQWHSALDKDIRDIRPWLALKNQTEALEQTAKNWRQTSVAARTSWVHQVATACPLNNETSDHCISSHAGLIHSDDGAVAQQWLQTVIAGGQTFYDSHFGVKTAHPGVELTHSGNELVIAFFMLGVSDDLQTWIQERLTAGWNFAGIVSEKLTATTGNSSGAIKVEWQTGALPHVNGIAGDTITMDSNTAKWLEQTQITMTHEFGHVMGFPDCYIEFWDESIQSFTFYTLDAEDRMCALSGGTLERHKNALLVGYSH